MIFTGKISENLSNKIEQTIISNNEIKWTFCVETSGISDNFDSIKTKDSGETFQFEHYIISSIRGVVDQKLLSNLIFPLVSEYQKKYPEFPTISHINRVKLNLLTQNNNDKCLYHMPHVDNVNQHWVLLYYINDSDGPTYIFDKKYNGQNQNLLINRSIFPQKGTFIAFDGLLFHASSTPKKSNIRAVINMNFQS